MAMATDLRGSLPDVRDEDNPIVWCERCQKHHKRYTFTRQDLDRVVQQQAKALADAIDARIVAELYGSIDDHR
jgi:hypothetical protein